MDPRFGCEIKTDADNFFVDVKLSRQILLLRCKKYISRFKVQYDASEHHSGHAHRINTDLATTSNMAIYDVWKADDGYASLGEELCLDVSEWPSQKPNNSFTLRLEEMTHFDFNDRHVSQARNLLRLEKAKGRKDINHLEVHYTCCLDEKVRLAIEALLCCDDREWVSFTMQGINGMSDYYFRPAPLEDFMPLFLALKSVQTLTLYSCAWFRGHGLDAILKLLPTYTNLRELRLQGWQLDRVSIAALVDGCTQHQSRTITLLSLRSCAFLGEGTFDQLLNLLLSEHQLKTLNLSYCNLNDSQIVPLFRKLKHHRSLECLHIGGNKCVTRSSVLSVADLISDDSCLIKDLNLRALWASYSEEGLLRRMVDLSPLFKALGKNLSLRQLSLSENCIDTHDISQLAITVPRTAMRHLDLGDNPFTEKGASLLFKMVQSCTQLESLRFENHYMTYSCAGAIRAAILINHYTCRIPKDSKAIPLSLWGDILSRIGQSSSHPHCTDNVAPSLVYHFLQATAGDSGLPLSMQFAPHRKEAPTLR